MTERVIVADPDSGDINWVAIEALFVGGEDESLGAFMDGIKAAGDQLNVLAKVTNIVYSCGQVMTNECEHIIQLPDGRVVLTDSDEGMHLVTEGPVEDADSLLNQLEAIIA